MNLTIKIVYVLLSIYYSSGNVKMHLNDSKNKRNQIYFNFIQEDKDSKCNSTIEFSSANKFVENFRIPCQNNETLLGRKSNETHVTTNKTSDNTQDDSNLLLAEISTNNFRIKREILDFNGTDVNTTYVDFNQTYESEEEYILRVKNYIFPKSWTWVIIFLHIAVFVIGLVGNILVCVAVYRNHTMRTVTNYFIVNLAVADFLVILICLPPSVIWDVTMTWFLGVAVCKIALYLQTVSITVSVLTLTFISVDRWYAICFPLKFKSTTGRAKTAIAIIWTVALIFDIPELVVYSTVANNSHPYETIYFTQCEATWSVETEWAWMIAKMVLLYAFPLIFMTIAYSQIICVLWKSANVHQHSLDISGGRQVNTFTMNTNTTTEGQLRSRRKAAKMLVAVVIMFAVCYFPVHLLCVLRTTFKMENTELNRAFFLIAHWLCYANSAVNPIIYNFMSGKFRKEFRRGFERCCQPATTNHRGYQLSNLCPQHKDSGIASRSQSDSSKKIVTEVRRLETLEGFVSSKTSSRPSSEKDKSLKFDV